MSVWEAGGERGERAEAEGPAGDRGLTPGGRCRGSHVGSERRVDSLGVSDPAAVGLRN